MCPVPEILPKPSICFHNKINDRVSEWNKKKIYLFFVCCCFKWPLSITGLLLLAYSYIFTLVVAMDIFIPLSAAAQATNSRREDDGLRQYSYIRTTIDRWPIEKFRIEKVGAKIRQQM